MKFNLKNINERWKEYALAGCVCVVFCVALVNIGKILKGLWSVFSVTSPLFIGFLIAYILNILAVIFEQKLFVKIPKQKLRWGLSIIISFILVLALLILLIAMLIPQIAGNIESLLDNADIYIEDISDRLYENNYISNELVENIKVYILGENGLLERIGSYIANNIKTLLVSVSDFGGKAVNWGVGIILALYFLFAKEAIINTFDKLLKLLLSPLKYYKTKILTEKFNTIFSKYIGCELIDSLIVGIINYLFMVVTGMPNALFISVIIGVTNLVPTFGPIFGAVIGGFILLLSMPGKLIMFLIFTVILQTIDGYVVKPKLFGGVLNVPGALILVSIIVFGKLFGITGMLLAIPIAAIIVYLYIELFIPWLELKRDVKQYNKELEVLEASAADSASEEKNE